MMTTYTPTRSVLLAFLTVAVSLSLALPIAASGASSSGQEQEKGKDKKAMTKTESGLKYRDIEEGKGEPPSRGPELRGALYRLAVGERRQGQGVRQLGQARHAFLVPCGRARSDQGLGRRRLDHESRRQAGAHHPCRPRLR